MDLTVQCMVTPFAGVHIFWSVLFSRFWLHERVGKWQLTGASGVISGVVLLVLFAGHGPSAEDFAEESVPLVDVYVALASEPLAVGYFAASASVVTVLLVLSLDLYPAKLQGWGTAVRVSEKRGFKAQRDRQTDAYREGRTQTSLRLLTPLSFRAAPGHRLGLGSFRRQHKRRCKIFYGGAGSAPLRRLFNALAVRRERRTEAAARSALPEASTVGE